MWMRWVRKIRRTLGRRWMQLDHRRDSELALGAREFLDKKGMYTSQLRQCGDSRALVDGKHVHAQITASGLDKDLFLSNLLVQMYGKCGDVACARAVFDSMQVRNKFSWTIMIGAYAQMGHGRDALELFQQMDREGLKPTNVTYVTVLGVCSSMGAPALGEGKAIHAQIIANRLDSDLILCNNLVNMYGKCGSLEDARNVFQKAPKRDVVSWTAMIAAYAQLGHSRQALKLFKRMGSSGEAKPNEVTFITVLGACSNLQDLAEGREIHACILADGFSDNVVVATALVNMYGKCGSSDEARSVFSRMPQRDVIAWNAVIAAYAQQGQGRVALELFRQMDLEGVKPETVSFISVLDGCSSMGGLPEGRAIHARILASRTLSDVKLGNTLINMYGKCGSLDEARNVFESMVRLRDGVSWAALIAAYAHHGHCRKARKLFERMELEGIEATSIAFISILGACSHAGLLHECRSYFLSMVGHHRIQPTIEHYACMIDLLGRVGRLDEVEDLISNMPFEPGGLEWRCFLGACKTQADVERGVDAAEFASKLEPEHPAPYVILSSIYRDEPRALV